MKIYLLLHSFFLAAVITVIIIPPIIWVAKQYKIMAMVQPNRWHQKPIPLLGGAGIFISFAASYFILSEEISWILMGGSFASFITGLADDIKTKSALFKVCGQLLAGCCMILSGVTFNTGFYFTDCLLTLAWTVLISNAINLLDNMDGAAAGISAIITCTCGIILFSFHFNTAAVFSFCCMGAGIGFLAFNFKPASIFMGDSGSLLLGYCISFLSILTVRVIAVSPGEQLLTAIILLALPLTDTLFVIVSRIRSGINILQGGKDHLSHRMAAMGYKETVDVISLYGFTTLWNAAVLLKSFLSKNIFLLYTAAVALLTIVFCYWLSVFRRSR